GANYRCEREGPLATASIGGRVRYRGSLADPNELSLFLAIALPFALALATRPAPALATRPAPGRDSTLPLLLTHRLIRRAVAVVRAIPLGLGLLAAGYAVVLSRSRSGLLVYLAVLGVSFVRRVGAWGLVAGCVIAPPMLIFGGRSGAEADESSDER